MDKVKLILDVAQLMLQVVEDMRRLSDSVQKVCDTVTEGLSEDAPKTIEKAPAKAIEKKVAKKEEPQITLEQVRGVLAQKSQEGFSAEVREIIQKYGASRLSEIDPKDFKAVLADAEVLGND